MATSWVPACSRKESTARSRSSTDGAFRAAAKPMRKLEFPFVSPIGRHASRFAALIPPEIPDCVFSHAEVTEKQSRGQTPTLTFGATPPAVLGLLGLRQLVRHRLAFRGHALPLPDPAGRCLVEGHLALRGGRLIYDPAVHDPHHAGRRRPGSARLDVEGSRVLDDPLDCHWRRLLNVAR